MTKERSWIYEEQSVKRRLDTCLAEMEKILASKKKSGFDEEDWEYWKALKSRCDRLLKAFREEFITKDEAIKRGQKDTKNLKNAGEEITTRFMHELKNLDKNDSLSQEEICRVWDKIVLETWSEPPLGTPHNIRPVTLSKFIEQFCEKSTKRYTKSIVIKLRRADKNGEIKLPQPINTNWKSGRGYDYIAQNLIDNWPEYQEKLQGLISLKVL